jgi:transposase InsO family protein
VRARVYDDVITSRSSLGLLALDGHPFPRCVDALGSPRTRRVPQDSESWKGCVPLQCDGGRRRGRLRRGEPRTVRSQVRRGGGASGHRGGGSVRSQQRLPNARDWQRRCGGCGRQEWDFISFVDDYSGYSWITLLRQKSSAITALKDFLVMVQTQHGCTIKEWMSDARGEYKSDAFLGILKAKGIKIL